MDGPAKLSLEKSVDKPLAANPSEASEHLRLDGHIKVTFAPLGRASVTGVA